jgi:hypothetical protein
MSNYGGFEAANKTAKGSAVGLRARRSKASLIRPATFPPLLWIVAATVDNVLLTFAPASVIDPKLTFRAITEGLRSLSARLLSAGTARLSAQ